MAKKKRRKKKPDQQIEGTGQSRRLGFVVDIFPTRWGVENRLIRQRTQALVIRIPASMPSATICLIQSHVGPVEATYRRLGGEWGEEQQAAVQTIMVQWLGRGDDQDLPELGFFMVLQVCLRQTRSKVQTCT